jgi:hypothetical protein
LTIHEISKRKYQLVVKGKCGSDGSEKQAGEIWTKGIICLNETVTSDMYFFHDATVGQGLLSVEASYSHSDTQHSVGILWMNDRPGSEIST